MAKPLQNIRRLALTTSQAAEYCFVSKGTIQNWIKTGQLPAQRTAGGQFRVRVDRLMEFMRENAMSVEALEFDYCIRRKCHCWEYFDKAYDHAPGKRECDQCVVKQTQANLCFELRRHVDKKKVLCQVSCAKCEYRDAFLGADEPDGQQLES